MRTPKVSSEDRKADSDKAMAEYRSQQTASHKNMLRLREERLAREASASLEPLAPKKARKATKKSVRRGVGSA